MTHLPPVFLLAAWIPFAGQYAVTGWCCLSPEGYWAEMYTIVPPYAYLKDRIEWDRRRGRRLGAQFRRPVSLVIEQ